MFTDTHCHIFKEYYENVGEVFESAKKSNVERYFVSGCDTPSNQEVLELIKTRQDVYGVIGLHPEVADSYQEEDLEFIKNHIKENKILAIGEIGLDYHYTKENKEKQKELFERQLKIALENHLPVVIHSREATEDTISILKKYPVKGVIHSFSGSYETAQIYIKMGFLLGINGVITFKNSHLKEVVENLPLSSLILETDSPYLAPHPYRGSKNMPANVSVIATFLADLLGVTLQDLSKITNQNIDRIFDKLS